MQVDVIASVNEVKAERMTEKTVIVIDVLRATSTIVAALAFGCSAIVPIETVQQAGQLQMGDDVLGGERFCQKIAGFHYGNSPAEYSTPDIAGKRVILTTTNGTLAIHRSRRASRLFAGCMLNARACAKAAFAEKRDVAIVCAGTHGSFCLEDGLCAGLLVRHLQQLGERETEANDLGIAMRLAFDAAEDRLVDILLACPSGKRLDGLGHRDDVRFCSQRDRFDLVPVWDGQALIRLA